MPFELHRPRRRTDSVRASRILSTALLAVLACSQLKPNDAGPTLPSDEPGKGGAGRSPEVEARAGAGPVSQGADEGDDAPNGGDAAGGRPNGPDVSPDAPDVSPDGDAGSAGATSDRLPLGFDLYVDAIAGDDVTGNGQREHPLRTISRATNAALAFDKGADIYVAEGRYDGALGETFPILLRGGTSIFGAGAAQTIVQGTGAYSAAGTSEDGTYAATIIAGDAELPTTISGIAVRSEGAGAGPGRYGVVCDRGDAVTGNGAAATLLDGVSVGPGYERGVEVTSTLSPIASACHLRMRSSRVAGTTWGILARGCPWEQDSGSPVTLDIGEQDAGNVFEWNTASSSNDGAGILIQHCVASAAIRYNSFNDAASGVWIHQFGENTHTSHFTVEHNVFSRLSRFGVLVRGKTPWLDLNDNTMEATSASWVNAPGIQLYTASAIWIDASEGVLPRVHARGNRLVDNDAGVTIYAPYSVDFDSERAVDFGTQQSPGLNTFQCSGRRDGLGGDLELQAAGSGTLPFSGNRWDHSPPTIAASVSADSNTDVILFGDAEPNIDVSDASAESGCR
jgi:uncharacterized protein DUF1565